MINTMAIGFYVDSGNRNLAMPLIMSSAKDLHAKTIKVRRPGHIKPGNPLGERYELPKEKFSIHHHQVKPHLEEIFSPAWMFGSSTNPVDWKYDAGKRIYLYNRLSFTILLTNEGQLKNPEFQQQPHVWTLYSVKEAENAIITALQVEDIHWVPLVPQ